MMSKLLEIVCEIISGLLPVRKHLLTLALFLIPTSIVLNNVYAINNSELSLGIFPRRNFVQTMEMFSPVASHLSKKLGTKVTLDSTKDFKTFWQNVLSKKYDIVHFNQYHYIISNKNQGYQVIAKNEEFGKSKIAGAIVVRSDHNINHIEHLRGKKIIYGGDKMAMQSFVIAKYLMDTGGLNSGDYKQEFAINPPNAIMAVYLGHADAAGAGDQVLNLPLLKKKIDVSKLKYLKIGPSLPHLPWAVRKDMPNKLKQKIRNVLVSLKDSQEGKTILRKARLTNLVSAEDSEYDHHRKIIAKILRDLPQNEY